MTIPDALRLYVVRCVWALGWWGYTYTLAWATTGSHPAAVILASITGSTLSKDADDHDRKATR